jgi:hypothetical protein
MNQRSRWVLYQALLVTALSGPGDVTAAGHPEHVARIHVVFVQPEKFTDARRADFKPNSEAILDAIAKFMQETGEETLPRE